MGKTLEEHLRFAVAYWHSFAWEGGDPFGGKTFDRPWFGSKMNLSKLKADAAFEMFEILGVPFFCFHDADVRPEGDSFAENSRNLEEIIDYFEGKMETSKTKLLWGTANLFSHRRFMAGAATNPDPDVFAFSAATIKTCMDAVKITFCGVAVKVMKHCLIQIWVANGSKQGACFKWLWTISIK